MGRQLPDVENHWSRVLGIPQTSQSANRDRFFIIFGTFFVMITSFERCKGHTLTKIDKGTFQQEVEVSGFTLSSDQCV